MANFFNWSRKGRGARRATLRALFDMDAAQLKDLGLTRYDIADAQRSGDAAGLLAARRDACAEAWLR